MNTSAHQIVAGQDGHVCFIVGAIAVGVFLIAGCSRDIPYSYPHDISRPDLAKLYLIDDSRAHRVTIMADDTLIWRGVVGKSDRSPNIHPVGVPSNMQERCRVRIIGAPYSIERDVDWANGKALAVHFLDESVVLDQLQEPVGFQ